MVEVLPLVEARLRAALGEPDARASVTFLGADRIEVLRFTETAAPGTSGGAGPADRAAEGVAEGVTEGTAGVAVPSESSVPGAGRIVRYATLGMSAAPMTDPSAIVADPLAGPRAELVLSVRAGRADTDKVLRALAVLAASPQVEGVIVAPGSSLDVGGPLWPGAPFTSVLVAEPGGLVEDLELDAPLEPVRFLPLLPMTPNEAAWKRVHGAQALQERWLTHGTDLRDPLRKPVPLG